MEIRNETDEESGLNLTPGADTMEGIKKLSQPVRSQVLGSTLANPKQKTHTQLHKENSHFQQKMQSQNAKKAYYIPEGIPVEKSQEIEGSGKFKGCISILCAFVSLLLFPIGIIGIIFGVKARNIGSKNLGTLGIVLSAVFMLIGIFVASWHFNTKETTGGVAGLIIRSF
jgi:uncharacterized protein YbaR (Trm112 family)